MADSDSKVCVVVGVGPGNGEAFARRFSQAGYSVGLLARSGDLIESLASELPSAAAAICDVTDGAQVQQAIESIRSDLGPVHTVIYNAGSGVWGTLDQVSLGDFETTWRVNAYGALAVCQAVVGDMRALGEGNIVFVGATATTRGGAGTLAFASAKAAQKNLAESIARHLWPENIHVALMILDGMVDLPRTRAKMPDKPDTFFAKPADIADTVYGITQQKPSAWTFNFEARPFGENW